MMNRYAWLMSLCALMMINGGGAWAVKTTTVVQSTERQCKDGQAAGVVVSSEGEITLSYQTETLLGADPNVWVINAVVSDPAGTIYAATSGSGYIYRIGKDKASKIIYGQGAADQKHVFSLAIDARGRLLAGTGGQAGLLLQFDADGSHRTLFSDEQIKYIWSIVIGPAGRIYLGTGPTGKVFTLEADGARPEMVYQTKENNILSLALDAQGILYAGGDKNGLVYRIDPAEKKATIAYNTEQKEISGLVFDKAGNLYIATGDARAGREQGKFSLTEGEPGRQDKAGEKMKDAPAPLGTKPAKPGETTPKTVMEEAGDDEGGDGDETPPTPPQPEEPSKETPPMREVIPADMAQAMPRPMRGGNFVYKMTPGGFITPVFNKPIVILSTAYDRDKDLIILGTGNDGQVIKLDGVKEESTVLHSAKPSGQVSAVFVNPTGVIYAGLANPAGLIAIFPSYARQGEFLSGKIDAQQVSQWGSLTVDAQIPDGSRLMVSTRTGNTKNPDDSPWQDWSASVNVTDNNTVPIQSAPGRYLQYRLNLESATGEVTPIVRKVAQAYMIPNLPPKVRTITLEPVAKKNTKPKPELAAAAGDLKITWKAEDPNKDKLFANVYIRLVDHQKWIRIAKELKTAMLTWNTYAIADGRYEFEVEVTDLPDNPPDQALTDTRISRPIIIDNTPPEIREFSYTLNANILNVHAVVCDALTPIGEAGFCLDGAETWQMALPVDKIFDNQQETVELSVKIDQPGEHLLAVYFADALGNKIYRNVTVTLP
jgi:hypothetical protein